MFLANPLFAQRPPRLQLQLIELIVFVAMLSSAVIAQTSVSEKPALDITVTGITRHSPDLFEIRYTLKNKGSVDLYLPYIQIAGSTELTSYSVLHRTNEGAWINIGPTYDVASYKAKILGPGAGLSLVDLISDTAVATFPNPGGSPRRVSVAIQGRNRIRVGYYSGAAAWQQRLNATKEQEQSRQTLRMPRLEVAYSDQFEIPPAAK